MTKPEKILLVQMLARHEAPWLPIGASWDSASAIYARRRGEVPPHSGAGSDARRQQASRLRAELSMAGLVHGLSLTAAGRHAARGMVWPFERREIMLAGRRLSAAIARGERVVADDVCLVSEASIAGDHRQAALLRRCVLPLLADQRLVSRSTPRGEAFFGLARGVSWGAAVNESFGLDATGGFDEELAQAYWQELKTCRATMLADSNYFAELGELPIVGAMSSCQVAPLFK